MTCEQYQELLGEYVLGALSAEEEGEVRRHLAKGCPACEGALAEARAIVAMLPWEAEGEKPSAIVWAKLENRMSPKTGEIHRGAAMRAMRVAAVIVLVAGVTAVATYFVTKSSQPVVAPTPTQVVVEKERLLADPEVKLILMSGTGDQAAATGRIAWDAKAKRWYVYLFNLKQLPPGKVYELWVITADSKKVPAGTFSAGQSGEVAGLTVELPEVGSKLALAAVTEEPAGGSEQPTSSPFLAGKVQ